MSVDTSIAPYYDDFDIEKNFHKILFKPGVAVQARELTQSQSILQEQIKRVGDYLFTNGDKVSGSRPSVNTIARTVRLKETNSAGEAIDVTRFLNMYVTSPESEVIGQVEFIFRKDDPDIGDPPTIVINLRRYTTENNGAFDQNVELYFYTDLNNALNKSSPEYRAVTANDIVKQGFATATEFSRSIRLRSPNPNIVVGDYLEHPLITKNLYVVNKLSDSELEVSDAVGANISSAGEGGDRIQFVQKATSPTIIVTQDTSIYYKDGFFIRSALQKIVPDKNSAFPTKIVGFFTQEDIITNNDDNSLLDPALGSSNYFAEGADRLKISLDLVSLDLDDILIENTSASNDIITRNQFVQKKLVDAEDFIPLIRFNQGRIEFVKEVTISGTFGSALADRTFDESGNYVVDRFEISPADSVIYPDRMFFNVSPGKAYVGGVQVKTVGTTEISTPANTSNIKVTSYNVNTTQGNYIRLNNLEGGLIAHDEIVASDVFVELHNVETPVDNSTRIGIAAVKSLEFDSFNGDAPTYKLFYHYYEPANEVPASWDAWATKYNIPVNEGRYLSSLLYESNERILTQDQVNGPIVQFIIVAEYYGLFREPDAAGLAYWHGIYKTKYNKQVTTEFLWEFVNAALADTSAGGDGERVRTNSKTFLQVSNGSPFIDGLVDVAKVRSVIGVANEYTAHGTAASYTTPFFYGKVPASGLTATGDIILFDPKPSDALVFDTGKTYVKTVENITTEYRRVIKNAGFVSGVFTRTLTAPESFALGNGEIPTSVARQHYIVLVKSGQTANVRYGIQTFENATVTISNESRTLQINMNDLTFNGVADVSIRVQNDNLTQRRKTLVNDAYKYLNINTAEVAYDIGKADVSSFKSIIKLSDFSKFKGIYSNTTTYSYGDVVLANGLFYESIQFGANLPVFFANSWTTIDAENPNYYITDNGQRDSFYDHGYVTYIGPSSGIPGNVLIAFDYFSHSGEGPCTAQSYDESLYGLIPVYRSTVNARNYDLRDCIDFRPRRVDDTAYQNFQPAVFPLSFVNTEIDLTYYIGRIDRIYVVNNLQNFDSPYDKFYIEQGLTSENPTAPLDTSDKYKLSIGTLDIPPFVVSSFDVNIEYDQNRRYTMRDIGEIDSLVKSINKTVKVHSMQIEILQATVMNEDTGEILVKSGVLIEDFTDLTKCDIATNQFSVIVDTDFQEAYPAFNSFVMDLDLIPDQDIAVFNDIITMPFTQDLFVSQTEANSTLNINPGAIDDGKGRARISKKNSFVVNLLISGGLLVGAKTLLSLASVQASLTTLGGAIGDVITKFPGWDYIANAFQSDTILGQMLDAVKGLGYKIWDAIPTIDLSSKAFTFKNFGLDLNREVFQSFTKTYVVDPANALFTDVVKFGTSIKDGFVGYVNIFKESGFGPGVSQIWNDSTNFVSNIFSSDTWFGAADSALMTDAANRLSGAFNFLLEGNFNQTIAGITEGFKAFSQTTIGQTLKYVDAIAKLAQGDVAGAAKSAAITYAISYIPVVGQIYTLVQLFPVISDVAKDIWNGVKSVASAIGKGVKKAWKKLTGFLSDIRLKENIKYVRTDSNGLNLYTFKYKECYQSIAGRGTFTGYIAQEVLEKYPKAVSIAKIRGEEFYTVNYSMLSELGN